jgi:hypothetical protein
VPLLLPRRSSWGREVRPALFCTRREIRRRRRRGKVFQ